MSVKLLALVIPAMLFICRVAPAQTEIFRDRSQPIEKRVDDLLSKLTLEEKVALCHASSIFATAGVPRLGVPELTMDDGPMGVREDVGNGFSVLNRSDDFATAFPAPIALAATWDPKMAQLVGQTIGAEAAYRGKNIMLAPAINMQRTPLNGRTFEYYGEDPYLTGVIASNYIKAMQAQGVAACVKHFAVNNQETQRSSVNVELDERTLREIYLPAFKMAVKEGGALAVMSAYNKVRGQFCAENDYLLNKILKTEWGFKGVVISDWGGTHTTEGAALGGLDIEMGTGSRSFDQYYLASPFLEALQSGKIPTSVVDEKARRHLYVMFKLKMFDAPPATRPGALSTPEHHLAARTVAEQGMVLIKNQQNLLPLDVSKIKTIAVIGANATARFAHTGFGAGVKATYETTALEGITAYVGDRAKVTTAAGYAMPGARGGRGRGRGATAPASAPASAPNLLDAAVEAARNADVVVFVGGLAHVQGFDDEGRDKTDLKLPGGQDELIAALIKANPKTVVCLAAGSPVEMPWLADAPAVLQSWFAGMEGGAALARVLFGDVNPSGKLPCTFPKALADSPAHALGAFPGSNGVVKYEEGLLIGYRWFDTKNIEPLLPFGHGLSYTKFEYSNLRLARSSSADAIVTATFDIANVGQREGAEVAQLYVQDVQSTLPRPTKELKGFVRVSLKPGQKQTVSIPLDRGAFSYFDPEKHGWLAEAGDFKIFIGSSSRDLRLDGTYRLTESIFNDQP
jgi:beta-glucosidase